jgi:hypothetical protein
VRFTCAASGVGRFNRRRNFLYPIKQTDETTTAKLIDKVQIYDLAGKLVYSKSKLIQTETMYLTASPHEVLVVKITLADGSVVTKKLIFWIISIKSKDDFDYKIVFFYIRSIV